MKQWKMVDIDNAEYLGILELPEEYDFQYFEILKTKDYLVFGSVCNVGFSESGHLKIDEYFSLEENIQILLEELEAYYSGERDLDIVYNECM